MIRIPNNIIYLATQRTASRTVSNMLINQCGGVRINERHHACLADMALLKQFSEPVCTFLRNPYEYIQKRYCYKKRSIEARKRCTLEQFVPLYSERSRKEESGSVICPYHDYIDRYFLFERGVKTFFEEIGFPNVDVLTVGVEASKQLLPPPPMSEKYIKLVDKYFAKEVSLYNRVKEEL